MNESEQVSTQITEEESEEQNNASPETIDNSMGEFYQLRNNIFIGTLLVAVIGLSVTWWLFGQQTSLNYLLGTCFSLVYVNMLAKEVEKVGANKKGIGSTRLAIFVGLIIVATQREQLQVIPIFLGFMAYKLAILFYVLPSSLLAAVNESEPTSTELNQ